MKYKVAVSDSAGATTSIDVQDVSEIVTTDLAYYLYNKDGEILFTAPLSKVVFVKKY